METEARKRKQNIFHIVLCVGLLAVIWGGYVFAMREVHRFIELCKDDFSWVYQVDSVAVEGDEFVLTGFAFELGKDAEKKAYDIVLQDIETGKNYFSKMQYSERKDVNEYFLCEYDYLNSGFTARIKADKLDLQNRNYEVILQKRGTRKAYRTGTYVSKGRLMYVNPKEYVPLDVAGTDLEEIVEKGVLRVYRPDVGMYVYQYEGELYWIAEPEYGFDNEGNTRVQYHLYTSQLEKLPKERLINNWYWDNRNFSFLDKEILKKNAGKYRLSKFAFPKEYSIIKILTGNHIDGWIWRQEFRPYYLFE